MFFQSLIAFTDDEEKEKEKPERQDKILVYGLGTEKNLGQQDMVPYHLWYHTIT